MLLPDHEIERLCRDATAPLISPYDPDQLQPASYDLRLSRKFLFPGANNTEFSTAMYNLVPGALILGCTQEVIRLPPGIAGEIAGKSGNARRGLQVEAAGHIDPGYEGVLTLELVNLSDEPCILRDTMLIAQIWFARLESPCRTPYSFERNRHQFAAGPTL